jgi:hypothetical protein
LDPSKKVSRLISGLGVQSSEQANNAATTTQSNNKGLLRALRLAHLEDLLGYLTQSAS